MVYRNMLYTECTDIAHIKRLTKNNQYKCVILKIVFYEDWFLTFDSSDSGILFFSNRFSLLTLYDIW